MEHQCLQDVLDEIYYGESNALDWYEPPIIQALKDYGTKDELMTQLAYYFKIWDEGERGLAWKDFEGDFKQFERASWCFYYIFQALPLFKDPSIIPDLMQYFPPEGPNQWPWTMEDMWTETMLQDVASYHDYGQNYIPWLMKSLNLLPKGAEDRAKWFFGHMIFDTFTHIDPKTGDFPCIEFALALGDRKTLLELAKHEVSDWQDELRKAESSNDEIEWSQTCKERLACSEYVLSHLLHISENVVPLHVLD